MQLTPLATRSPRSLASSLLSLASSPRSLAHSLLASSPRSLASSPRPLARSPRPPARSLLPLACSLLSLAACSPYQIGPPPADPLAVTRPFTPYLDGMATVCVIRTSRLAMAVTFVMHDNDLLVGATRGPTWFCWRAEPGHHRITVTAEDGGQRFEVDLVARGRYYLEQGLDYRLGFVTPRGRWVDETSALSLLQQSEHRILQGAPASESVLIGTDVAAAAMPPGPDSTVPPPGATATR